MQSVSGFWNDAGQVFEIASAAPGDESSSCDLAILIQPDGAIRMVDACGWQLPALAAHTGAETVYRVTRHSGRVRVEGRSRTHSCVLQSEAPSLPAPVAPPPVRYPHAPGVPPFLRPALPAPAAPLHPPGRALLYF